jgi:hypothetical protein
MLFLAVASCLQFHKKIFLDDILYSHLKLNTLLLSKRFQCAQVAFIEFLSRHIINFVSSSAMLPGIEPGSLQWGRLMLSPRPSITFGKPVHPSTDGNSQECQLGFRMFSFIQCCLAAQM